MAEENKGTFEAPIDPEDKEPTKQKTKDLISEAVGNSMYIENSLCKYKPLINGVNVDVMYSRMYPVKKVYIDIGKKMTENEIKMKTAFAIDNQGRYINGKDAKEVIAKIKGE